LFFVYLVSHSTNKIKSLNKVFFLGDCGEKLTLSISIFVALQVFYLLLVDLIPPTSLTVSLLGRYLLFTLVLVNLSTLLTIITLNIHWRHPNTHHMPNWVKRWFFQIIPPFIFMSKPHIANAILHSDEEDDEEKEVLVNKENSIKRLNDYMKNVSIDKYPPIIQQAVKDIRYISETQREAQKDDLVRIFLIYKINRILFIF
jgi:hypothetical protein